ncbi:MAG TPA: DUF4142 domain-containing protein [Phycisphaerae bacterium]|nr:DUF4142 domain-containing protein [Phycisphaerae bacterium]
MRFAIIGTTIVCLTTGCDAGPEPTHAAIDDRGAVLAQSSNDTTSRVRTVAFESGTRGERFIRNAASAARMQVELGRIAQRQASDARVKKLGRQMIEDHRKAERDLLDVAMDRDITIPPGMTPAHRSLLGQIMPLFGDAFDREYLRMMVAEHLTLVREYDEEARNGLDPQVRDAAGENLPLLRDHLQKARALANALSVKIEDEEASVPGAPREAERASPSLY